MPGKVFDDTHSRVTESLHSPSAAIADGPGVRSGRVPRHLPLPLLLSHRKHSGGYSISALSKLFGTHRRLVESWATRGLLGKPHVQERHGGDIRFTEAAVAGFIRKHPQEYDLSRVDRAWFKGIVFGVTETRFKETM